MLTFVNSISISPNGWTDQELGTLWLQKDFAPATAARLDDPGDYRLLILDGHNSHCTFPFVFFSEVGTWLHFIVQSTEKHRFLETSDHRDLPPVAYHTRAATL